MNILQLISGTTINGALTYGNLLCRKLADRGHQVTVTTRDGSWLNDQLDPRVTRVSTTFRRSFAEFQRLSNFVIENRIDLIHSHMSSANHFGVWLGRWSRVPVVASAHSFQFQLHWPFNSHVIANSDATARFMQRVNRVPANRISTVRCFIDLPKFRATPESYRSYYRVELHVRDEDFLVGVIGDVNPNKGQEYLIEAIPRMLKTIPRLKIAFIGRFHRNERHVQRLRRKLIEDQSFRRVKWLGIRENIHQYLKAFDVLCVPSLEESLGLVAAEGQAAGIPVIATDVGGLGEVVQNEQTGLMIPPRNSAAIAEAVIRLYRDRSLGELLAANAKAAVERNFDPETLTSQVESVYEQVLGRQQRAVA